MWLKLFLLTSYILLLLILSRVLEALSWCEVGYSGLWSRQLLDPMVLSVAKLKALLEQRGISYEHVVEKSELKGLVESSGQVTSAEANKSVLDDDESTVQTNFTSGAHFIEQVEDAKDSVWLVQVVLNQHQLQIVGDARWKAMRKKVSRFGVHTGVLDCSLDIWYCRHKNWQSPFLLLALPAQFEKKAAISMHHYSGPVRESVIMRWLRERLAERLDYITSPSIFEAKLQSIRENPLNPEIHAILFSQNPHPPLFYSALSVKFPGRVKFSFVNFRAPISKTGKWKKILQKEKIKRLPSYIVYSPEGNYEYGRSNGEILSFWSMERLFRFLHPCLNDIFIISFIVANTMSLFEPFISNCGILKRIGNYIWCTFKYNIMVIMLWLPIIGIFQMPFLDSIPLLILKFERIFSISYLGTILRGDYAFYIDKPIYVYISFMLYLIAVTALCKKYRDQEDEGEDWFNYSNMNSLAQMRPNNFIGPAGSSGYDLFRGLEIFGSRLTQPSTWLSPIVSSDYIQYLPTFRYTPIPISEFVSHKAAQISATLTDSSETQPIQSNLKVEDIGCKFKDGSSKHICSSHTKPAQGNSSNINKCVDKFEVNLKTQKCCSLCKSHQAPETSDKLVSDESADSGDQCQTDKSNPCYPNDQDMSEPTFCPESSDQQTNNSVPRPSGFPPGYVDSHQCVICLEDYVPNTMLCGLPCGHVFHETCIFSWLNTEKHFCPMCRWPSYKIPDTVANRL